MASHFTTIGLPVGSVEDLAALVDRIAPSCRELPARRGRYLHWRDPSGAELWLQLSRDDELLGVHPHFDGATRTRVGLTSRVAGENALEGGFHGWANPEADDVEAGDYPFVFDAPGFGQHGDARIPGVAEVQLSAFAHELEVFESVAAFEAAAPEGEVRFASQSFVPSGLFGEAPEATAVFTGIVRRADRRTNEQTGRPFYWAEVDTLGVRVDVVVDPALVTTPPAPGHVVQGSFWLSGRLLDYPRRATRWWMRLARGVCLS